MRSSKSSSQNSSRDVLSHVGLYGLTTVDAVARLLFQGSRDRASAALRNLVAAGRLHQHQTLFTAGNRLPAWRDVVKDYAVLAYCCLGGRLRPLLAPEEIERLTGPVTARTNLPPVRGAKCYLHSTRRLALIRVYPNRKPKSDFERSLALKRLQQFVQHDAFRPWAYFAMNSGLILTYLVPPGPFARELSIWLARKPLVSRLVEPSVVVPVEVHEGKRLPRISRSR